MFHAHSSLKLINGCFATYNFSSSFRFWSRFARLVMSGAPSGQAVSLRETNVLLQQWLRHWAELRSAAQCSRLVNSARALRLQLLTRQASLPSAGRSPAIVVTIAPSAQHLRSKCEHFFEMQRNLFQIARSIVRTALRALVRRLFQPPHPSSKQSTASEQQAARSTVAAFQYDFCEIVLESSRPKRSLRQASSRPKAETNWAKMRCWGKFRKWERDEANCPNLKK